MGFGALLCIAALHCFAAIDAGMKSQWLLAGLLLTFAIGDVILACMAK